VQRGLIRIEKRMVYVGARLDEEADQSPVAVKTGTI
jgi:hypothetical protein